MNRTYSLLFVGILFASSSSILIRGAESHPLVTATYRMGLATCIMAFLTWIVQKGNPFSILRGEHGKKVAVAGIFLGIHFATWMTSLSYTSVASSVIIVDSSPLLVAVLSYVALGESVSWKAIGGICISICGAALIVYGDVSSSVGVTGVVLAALGAVGLACYLVIGRGIRKSVRLLPYVSSVYLLSFVTILLIAVLNGNAFNPESRWDPLLWLLLAAGPSCFGHTMYNHAMAHVSATFVSTAIIAEPIGASLLAALFLNEVPSKEVVIGGALVLLGIYVVARCMAPPSGSSFSP